MNLITPPRYQIVPISRYSSTRVFLASQLPFRTTIEAVKAAMGDEINRNPNYVRTIEDLRLTLANLDIVDARRGPDEGLSQQDSLDYEIYGRRVGSLLRRLGVYAIDEAA
jgi:hypothetical protein